MLAEPNRTPYDLSWEMFGIPVRIHPMFWLVAVVLGWNWTQPPLGLSYLFLWVLCTLVSILIHELGHVFMGQVFGARSEIVLWSFGGLAIGSLNVARPEQRIAVLLAGPGAGLLLYGLVKLVLVVAGPSLADYLDTPPNLVWAAFQMLLWMNLVWNVLNLVPIWPLDGGRVCGEVLMLAMGREGLKLSLVISIVLAALVALWAFFPEQIRLDVPILSGARNRLTGIMFVLLAVENAQLYSQLNDRRGQWD
jgi:Zn-dependent protease